MKKPQGKTGSTANQPAESAAAASPLKGYVPFPAALRTKDHVRPQFALRQPRKRTAVLVLHGIGAQKPYETLDQFARGLMGFFRPSPEDQDAATALNALGGPTQEILLRQYKANANTSEMDWTQAFVRVRPGGGTSDWIDVYEYYWAPVITGRVSSVQSLQFLISAGLSPFKYLRDNLTVINRAHEGASRANKASWLFFAFCREIYRMLFIFIPMIIVALGLYWLLASTIAEHLLPNSKPDILGYLLVTSRLALWQCFDLAGEAVRFLLLWMCINFLFQTYYSGTHGPTEKSPGAYVGMIWVLAAGLVAVPYFLQGHMHAAVEVLLHLPMWEQVSWGAGLAAALIGASLRSKILLEAWKRAGTTLKSHGLLTVATGITVVVVIGLLAMPGVRPTNAAAWAQNGTKALHWLTLPTFVRWPLVLLYALLALFAWISQEVLTTAIGCLAVYLGADDLSKNFAARSQILHECTRLLIDLLAGNDETGKPNEKWNYEQVIIAAHSLGSVIAYDSLSQLIVRDLAQDPTLDGVPLEKINGLLTFGCPLNKVFYFFRTRTTLQTNVLSQILYKLHSFRLRTALPPQANPTVAVPHPFPEKVPFSPEFRWFNAYSPFDIISGRMQFYQADLDVPVERGIMPWTAHLSYWENDDLYSLFSDLIYPRSLGNG